MPESSEFKYAFEDPDDGDLRDIFVLGTNLDYWQRFLDYLRNGKFALDYKSANGGPLPETAARVLESAHRDEAPTLAFHLNKLYVRWYFRSEDEIELDIERRQVQEDGDIDVVLSFMAELGRLLGKRVTLTAEMSDSVLLEFDPTMDRCQPANDTVP